MSHRLALRKPNKAALQWQIRNLVYLYEFRIRSIDASMYKAIDMV